MDRASLVPAPPEILPFLQRYVFGVLRHLDYIGQGAVPRSTTTEIVEVDLSTDVVTLRWGRVSYAFTRLVLQCARSREEFARQIVRTMHQERSNADPEYRRHCDIVAGVLGC